MKTADISTSSNEEAAIIELENNFAAAFNAADIDTMMKNYLPGKDLVVFDLVPRKEYFGSDAYHKNWVDFFSHFKGNPTIRITDLGITLGENIGFSHSIQHVTGIDKQDRQVTRTVRVTNGFKKIDGRWLIVMEHISVPVDIGTGKAVLTEKS